MTSGRGISPTKPHVHGIYIERNFRTHENTPSSVHQSRVRNSGVGPLTVDSPAGHPDSILSRNPWHISHMSSQIRNIRRRYRRQAKCPSGNLRPSKSPTGDHSKQHLAEVAGCAVRAANATEDIGEEKQQKGNERDVVNATGSRQILTIGHEPSSLHGACIL